MPRHSAARSSDRTRARRLGGPPAPAPATWSDHVIPLKRVGPDRPSNMQWQTVAEAKAKDKVE